MLNHTLSLVPLKREVVSLYLTSDNRVGFSSPYTSQITLPARFLKNIALLSFTITILFPKEQIEL